MSADERCLQIARSGPLQRTRCSPVPAGPADQRHREARRSRRSSPRTRTPQGRVIAILRLRRSRRRALCAAARSARIDAGRAAAQVRAAREGQDRLRSRTGRVTWVGQPMRRRSRGAARAADAVAAPSRSSIRTRDGGRAPGRACRRSRTRRPSRLWQAADIAAGLPQIVPETTEHFVPQMLNLDLLDAISFTRAATPARKSSPARRISAASSAARSVTRSASDEAPAPLHALHLDGAKVGEVPDVRPGRGRRSSCWRSSLSTPGTGRSRTASRSHCGAAAHCPIPCEAGQRLSSPPSLAAAGAGTAARRGSTAESVNSITRRSMPMPRPAVGGMPYSSART